MSRLFEPSNASGILTTGPPATRFQIELMDEEVERQEQQSSQRPAERRVGGTMEGRRNPYAAHQDTL